MSFVSQPNTGIYRGAANQINFSANGFVRATISNIGLIMDSGQIYALTQNAAGPSYTFVGDPDTGMYRVGTDTIGISTAGVGKFTISSTGQVTVGQGHNGGTPVAGTLAGASGLGASNVAGANLTIAGGNSTGTGAGGALIFQTAAAGSSGSTANTLTDRMTINSSGQIQTGDGTAAAPVLSFSADTDTGIFRLGSDQLAFANNGITRLVLSGAATYVGNGVSSASPVAAALRATNGSGTNIAGADMLIYGGESTGSAAGGAVRFVTASAGSSGTTANSATERMRITSGGALYLGNGQFSSSNPASVTFSTTEATGTDKAGTRLDIFGGRSTGSGNGGAITFTTSAAGSAGGGANTQTERVRVKQGGQVRFVPLAADPTLDVEDGDVYYNSATNKLRVRAGGAWVDLH
jgi:hypothetical protein